MKFTGKVLKEIYKCDNFTRFLIENIATGDVLRIDFKSNDVRSNVLQAGDVSEFEVSFDVLEQQKNTGTFYNQVVRCKTHSEN